MDNKTVIKLLVGLIIITSIGLLLIGSKVSNIDNNVNKYCFSGSKLK